MCASVGVRRGSRNRGVDEDMSAWPTRPRGLRVATWLSPQAKTHIHTQHTFQSVCHAQTGQRLQSLWTDHTPPPLCRASVVFRTLKKVTALTKAVGSDVTVAAAAAATAVGCRFTTPSPLRTMKMKKCAHLQAQTSEAGDALRDGGIPESAADAAKHATGCDFVDACAISDPHIRILAEHVDRSVFVRQNSRRKQRNRLPWRDLAVSICMAIAQLTHCNISRNPLGAEGGRAFASMIRTPTPQAARAHCQLYDEGAKAIFVEATKGNMPSVDYLYLKGNLFADGAMGPSAAFASGNVPKLIHLLLGENNW